MPAKSMTSPLWQVECPAMLCPPPRTATGRAWLRAKEMARAMSAASWQRATTSGRESIRPFQIERARSYSGSCGVVTLPRIDLRRAATPNP
jgi:hypothetical protein